MQWLFVTREPEYTPDWILGMSLAEWLRHEGYGVSAKGYGANLGRAPFWRGFRSGPAIVVGLRGEASYVLTSRNPLEHPPQGPVKQIMTTYPLVHSKSDAKVVYLPYPVSEEYFERNTMAAVFQVTREFRLEHRPRVVFGGDYDDGAGISILFHMARSLLRSQGELILLNGHPRRAQWAPIIKRLGLEGVVIFLPRLHPREETAIFHSADVYVDPTTGSDSFPIGALRAMASGLPIVTWETPLMTALSNRGALMVSTGRDEAWVPAVREALENQSLRERMIMRSWNGITTHRLASVGEAFLQIASQWHNPIPSTT